MPARRSGLGRGLEALIPQRDMVDQGYAVLPIDHIEPNPHQPRLAFDSAALNELTASIVEVGVLQPVVVRAIEENRYHILFNSAAPDVSRTDNQVLAQATNNLAAAFASINDQYPNSDTLRKLLLKLLLKFSGEQQDDDVLQQIMSESKDSADAPASAVASSPVKPDPVGATQVGIDLVHHLAQGFFISIRCKLQQMRQLLLWFE